MLKLFDNTFFKFFFGFIGILFMSLSILIATRYFGDSRPPKTSDLPIQATQVRLDN